MSACPSIDAGGYYVSSTGKRLVHGDMCSGLESLIPDTDGKGSLRPGAKPAAQPHGTAGTGRRQAVSGLFTFAIVLLVLGGIFAVWYQYLASAVAKAQVEELAMSVKSFAVSLAGLIVDKVSECLGKRSPAADLGLSHSAGPAARYTPLDEELDYFQPLPAPRDEAAVADAPSSNGPATAANGVYRLT